MSADAVAEEAVAEADGRAPRRRPSPRPRRPKPTWPSRRRGGHRRSGRVAEAESPSRGRGRGRCRRSRRRGGRGRGRVAEPSPRRPWPRPMSPSRRRGGRGRGRCRRSRRRGGRQGLIHRPSREAFRPSRAGRLVLFSQPRIRRHRARESGVTGGRAGLRPVRATPGCRASMTRPAAWSARRDPTSWTGSTSSPTARARS